MAIGIAAGAGGALLDRTVAARGLSNTRAFQRGCETREDRSGIDMKFAIDSEYPQKIGVSTSTGIFKVLHLKGKEKLDGGKVTENHSR